MDALDAIKLRRSIRKYKDMDVEWEKVSLIVQAACDAPSAGNLQDFKFIISTDKEKIKNLSECCLKQYWIQSAPVVIIAMAETEKSAQFYGIRGERLYSAQNCAAAVENMLIAATSLGLGSCWVGAFDENKVNELFDVPKGKRTQAIVTIGYADEVVPVPMKYGLDDQVFIERFGGRFMDFAASTGYYSEVMHREFGKTKDKLISAAEGIKDKIKDHIAKKKQEKEDEI